MSVEVTVKGALCALLLTSACAMPTPQSARPAGMEVRANGGKAFWEAYSPIQSNGESDTWNVGMSMYWTFQYPEEDE